jgi:hypothetical protein
MKIGDFQTSIATKAASLRSRSVTVRADWMEARA